jgi:hypothetical protein
MLASNDRRMLLLSNRVVMRTSPAEKLDVERVARLVGAATIEVVTDLLNHGHIEVKLVGLIEDAAQAAIVGLLLIADGLNERHQFATQHREKRLHRRGRHARLVSVDHRISDASPVSPCPARPL